MFLKALVIGDLHFKLTNTAEMLTTSDKILQHAVKTKPDFIVVLGDILDSK